MMTSKRALQTAFKMTAVYAFALTTAVACGKFEGSTKIGKATANGTASIVREGTPGPVASGNVTIDKVETVFLGTTEFSDYAWSLKISATHGGRALVFETFPSVHPFNEDGVQKDVAPMHYIAKGVCGDETCSKFAVLVDVSDSSNGTSFQQVQYWDLHINNAAPQKTLTNTDYTDVTPFYEAFSGLTLPTN
ncbi:hypothetical protein BH10BDE1_BH10BDE1_08590 [soil metagenome]